MRSERPLLIDRSAATTPPDEADVRTWAANQRVFVSSTIIDLAPDRAAAKRAILAVGAAPVLFEDFGGRDADPENAYTSEVDASTIYVGLLGARYGKPLPTRFSATHTEYLRAEERGLRIAVWAKDGDREGHQQSFLDEVQVFRTTQRYAESDELEALVETRLRQIAAEEIAPWVKLGHLVFRAREVSEGSGRVTVAARIRDGGVLAAIREIDENVYRTFDSQLTWAGRSRAVRSESTEVTTISANQHRVTMRFEDRGTAGRDVGLDMSTGNYSADDLTEIAVKGALFCEPNPISGMPFLAEMENPLAPVAALGLSEEVVRPVVHLFLTEALVGSGRVSRITEFALGPAVGSQRRVHLGWEEPQRYSNVTPGFRSVEGVVDLP